MKKKILLCFLTSIGSPKQCLLGNDDQNKPISNENISPTSRHTITKQTDCNGLMEKYLKLSLNTSSKSPVSNTCNQAVNGTKITNGYHSPSSKEKPLWFENGVSGNGPLLLILPDIGFDN